ncbi:MAG TPA: LysM peptidoglycan-binding domain-containing protein [Tissierellia bacterium]|nr:LysM peptidoglycan-binding domain-containing protein [Tissierellia bacterium]
MPDQSNVDSQSPVSPTDNSNSDSMFSNMRYIIKEKCSLKNIVITLMLIVIVASLVTIYKINEIRTRGYTVYYGDKEVGIVRTQEEANSVLDNIRKELCSTYDSDIVLEDSLKFEDTHAKDNMLTTPEKLESNIKSNLTYHVKGYVLKVNGQEIGYSNSREKLEQLLETIKEPYLNSKEGKIIDVSFVEDIKIEETEFSLNKISSTDEILEHILTGSEEVRTHIVEVGESLWTIAKMYGIKVDDLISANPDKVPERLQIGDEIKLTTPKPLITVQVVEEIEYTASTDFEVKTEYDNSMYKTRLFVNIWGGIFLNPAPLLFLPLFLCYD